MLPKNVTVNEPKIVVLNGLQYKVGMHGFVYCLLNNQWVKSTKDPKDLTQKIRKRIF